MFMGDKILRTLKFRITGQKIEKDPSYDFSGLVAGTKGYLRAEFQFDQEWTGCRKAAVFMRLGKGYSVPIINGACEIPEEALTYKYWDLRVVGEKASGYRITTGKVKVEQEG